jgi:hypothetical protein
MFLHPSARGDATAAQTAPGGADSAIPASAGLVGRACCCPANAVVRVIIPPNAARPRETDLLLCGHHYRISRRALGAAHATVRQLPGTPADTAAWIDVRQYASAAPAGRPAATDEVRTRGPGGLA